MFSQALMKETLSHDKSKFSPNEYTGFLETQDNLKQSKSGQDAKYKEGLKKEAIIFHVSNNRHHPEYWHKRNAKMPITEAIMMYFDGLSRELASRENGKISDFRDYIRKKLKETNQEHVIPIIEMLREEFPAENFVTENSSLRTKLKQN